MVEELKYKLQYFDKNHKLCWTDWRLMNEPFGDIHITSIIFNQSIEWNDPRYKEFCKEMNKQCVVGI